MKNRILFILSLLLSVTGFTQVTNKIQADSVKIYQAGGYPGELILENGTRSRTNGFLQNFNNGRTRFAYALDSVWEVGSTLNFRRGPSTSSFLFRDGIDSIHVVSDSLFEYKDGIQYFKGLISAASVAGKLNISDTAFMLNPYLRKSDTTGKWLSRVNASITGALGVNGSPITPPNGTLNFTWQGSNTQYVRGDGSLATFSSAVTAITNPLYALVNHSHLSSDISDFTTAARNLLSGGTGISYNPATGVISWTGSASGITSINGLTGTTQTFATGTSGTDFNIASVGTAHTFNFPTASAANRGLLSSADWSTFNSKLSGNQTITFTPTGDVTGSTSGTTSLTPALSIGANKVTDAMIRQSAGLSVIGRGANTTGNVADITAATDHYVLRRSGTSLAFGLLDSTSVTGLHTEGYYDTRYSSGGGGNPNSNIGSHYRLAIPNTNNIKTVAKGIDILLDSTTNTNAITVHADTTAGSTKLATQGFVDRNATQHDTLAAAVFYSARVGDIGFPQDGDSVVSQAMFAKKFIQVFREGFQQYLDPYSGVTYDSTSGNITFHGPLLLGERIYIEGRPTSNHAAFGVNGVMTYGSPSSFDTDAQAFFDAETTAGNSIGSSDKNAFNDFILGLKADGLWSKVTQMQFLAFGNFNYDKINIKSPGTYNFTSTNGTINYTTSGESGNATSGYINTGLNPFTAFANSNIHIATYSRTNSSTVGFDAGAAQASTSSQAIIASGWGTARTRIDNDVNTVDATTTSLGFFIGDRTNSTLLTLYKNGSSVGTNTTSSTNGLPNVNIYLHAYNGDGTAGLFIDRQLSFYSIGTHLSSTDVNNYNLRVEALMDHFGIGVQ